MKKTVSRFQRLQNTIIVAALVAPLLSFTTAPAHAVAATCAEGGVCQVGDIGPGGGIVFYVEPGNGTFEQIGASGTMCTTNCKYLEAAPNTWSGGSSDPAFTWTIPANQSSAVTGADGTAIGTGYQNSVDILNQSGAVISSSTAATAARAFGGGSKSDWYLPSKNELNELYLQKTAVGGFWALSYWSSSEQGLFARTQTFSNGFQTYNSKNDNFYVRPIRAFAPATQISITRAAVGTQRGTAFTTQPQITIQYTNNDTATVSSAVVTASINSGGTLVGTTTATAASGVATFSNLGVDGTVGTTYTISYTALDLPVASATVTLTGTTCNGATFTCQIGDTGPGGGKVFYVAPNNGTFTQIGASGTMCTTNCKYLEAAPNTWSGGSSDPTRTWATDTNSNQSTAVTGADGTAIGTGYQNSLDIVAQTGNVAASSAAVAARGYNSIVSGTTYTDWYLPSKDELNALYLQKTAVGGIWAAVYWSSTESNANDAWTQNFGIGDPAAVSKNTNFYVRPLRAFAPAVATQISITRAAVGTQRRIAFTTQPQVTIQFANNETVTASSAVVTASISSGGTLVGTTTATASSGVATFSNLGVDGTVGTTYTITYTALDLPVASATVTLTGTTCDGSTFTCQVGDTGPGGGKIFYVAPNDGTFTQVGATGFMCSTACKYLEAAPTSGTGAWTDQFYRWSGNINTLIGTTGTEIGTGYKNTLAIVAQSNTSDRAAKVSRGYSGPNSLRDWFLPSEDELNALYLQKTTVGGFVNDYYWSSSENGANTARAQFFGIGVDQDMFTKLYTLYLRPIRAFGTAPTSISVYAIGGVTAPVSGATPVSTVTAANGYTGTVTWSGSPTTFASSTIYTATITLTAAAGYTLAGVGANSYTVAGATLVTHSLDSGIVTAAFPATAAPTAAPVVYVAPTPVPYLKTLTTPKLNLKDGKLICTPGTYNAGYTLNGVIQGSATALFTPNTFTYNLLIDGVAQTLLAVTSNTSSHSWNMPTGSAGALLTCSVTVTANGLTNTDRSGDNTSAVSSALSTQASSISTANADYSALISANSKAYQKALTDNRAKWRSDTVKIRTDYYAERDRIRSLPSTKATRALSSAALKAYMAGTKKSAADYKASQPAALAVRDGANKAAMTARDAAIAKAKASYGTFIESIGYGVLIP